MSDDTSWIVAGAMVVTYNERPGVGLRLTHTTITKVNKRTFRVEGDDDLYEVATQSNRGGAYYGRRAVPAGGDLAHELGQRQHIETAERRVSEAYEAWRHDKGNRNRATKLFVAARLLRDLLPEQTL
jgi:hypothetical protein